ncbi:restriction endonuclease subunit S [Pseudomonas sp. 5Ae-yellow]|uniref:restriction endonuclease subunit S n=1 Tax=Pseudomonas sp. 5Ae-yellow TaxID=2759848 RepID=UPI0028739D9B|nr:restriction endonuclease subunit S [Pseudomonas sp. 5Ae-yellow]
MNQALLKLSPSETLDAQFLKLWMESQNFQEQIESLSQGVAIQNMASVKILKEIKVPAPTIPEQKRIVAILDQAFADIDKARALTEQNLKNARELFESYLQQVFSQRGVGWVDTTLGSVCDFQNGFAFKSRDAISNSNTQLIRMGNLYKNILDLNRKPSFYPDSFFKEYSQFALDSGDLIISLTGTVGKEDYGFTVEIPNTERNLLLNQRIAKIIKIDYSKIDKRFLLRTLRSRGFLDELYSTANGTRQANLSTVTMREIPILLPPIEQQQKICDDLERVEFKVKELKSIYSNKLKNLGELKKSLLQKTFSGELTKGSEVAV